MSRGESWGKAAMKKTWEGFLIGLGFWLARPLADWLVDTVANLVARVAGR